MIFFFILLFTPFLRPPALQATCPCSSNGQVTLCLDQACQNQTSYFQAGEKIYFQVKNEGDGSQQRLVRVLDYKKAEVSRVTLNRSGGTPYLYSAELTAPVNPGTYYVDVKIEGGGSNFASQRNFTVQGEANQPTIAQATLPPIPTDFPTSPVVASKTLTPTTKPVLSPPQSAGDSAQTSTLSFANVVREFFRKLFSLFSRWSA
jgi:hypothetical protein